MGRHTYQVEDRYRPGIYGGAWTGPYFVLSHEPPVVVPEWMTGTFISEDIEAAVARAKQAAGGKNVGILGANLAKQCLEHGLLDETIIHLAPVLLGDGVRLFAVPGGQRVRLEPTQVTRTDHRRISASACVADPGPGDPGDLPRGRCAGRPRLREH